MILYSLSGLLCCLYVNLGGSARLRTVVVPLQKHRYIEESIYVYSYCHKYYFTHLIASYWWHLTVQIINDFTTLHKHCLIFLQLFILCEENMEHTKRMLFTRSWAHKLNIWKLLHKFDTSPGELLKSKTQWTHCTQFLTVGDTHCVLEWY